MSSKSASKLANKSVYKNSKNNYKSTWERMLDNNIAQLGMNPRQVHGGAQGSVSAPTYSPELEDKRIQWAAQQPIPASNTELEDKRIQWAAQQPIPASNAPRLGVGQVNTNFTKAVPQDPNAMMKAVIDRLRAQGADVLDVTLKAIASQLAAQNAQFDAQRQAVEGGRAGAMSNIADRSRENVGAVTDNAVERGIAGSGIHGGNVASVYADTAAAKSDYEAQAAAMLAQINANRALATSQAAAARAAAAQQLAREQALYDMQYYTRGI